MAALASSPSRPGIGLGELATLLRRFGATLFGDGNRLAHGLSQDSRRIEPGEVFAARPGQRSFGTSFVEEALRRGAGALLLPRGASTSRDFGVPVIEVESVEEALPWAAEAAFGFPSRSLRVIGITGTNGKTTTSWILRHVLTAIGAPASLLGTLGFYSGDAHAQSSLTTPEADQVARFQAQALALGSSHFAMEVSSHALVQHRVDATRFAVAAFTNLTQDHLDFHGTMEAYFDAKTQLFTRLSPEASVVFAEGPYAQKLLELAQGRLLSVALDAPADLRVLEVEYSPRGFEARAELEGKGLTLKVPLTGEHNLKNAVLALGIVHALGLDVWQAADALHSVPDVPGRMERCDTESDDVKVVVDYAHTPDALERCLKAARPWTQGRLICLFGCGGDRDATKRPRMGERAREHADFTFITNDNPRSEAPELIAQAIEQAFAGSPNKHRVLLDREAAIREAILSAAPGDVVVIAGKGHETYQIIGGQTREFDDREHAREALRQRRGTAKATTWPR